MSWSRSGRSMEFPLSKVSKGFSGDGNPPQVTPVWDVVLSNSEAAESKELPMPERARAVLSIVLGYCREVLLCSHRTWHGVR